MDNAPYDIYDYDIIDASGRKLGQLTGFWVDETTSEPQFASVKTGWLLGREHVIPIGTGQIDHASRQIRVPYEERTIRGAPGFPTGERLSEDDEAQVYQYYSLGDRYARGGLGLFGRDEDRETETVDIPLREENVHVGKRTVDENAVRLRKVVRTEVREVPVELRRERIDIERIPASELRGRGELGARGEAFREDEIRMTERREEPVVERTSEIVGGVRATKVVDHARETVRANVQREDVEIDRDGELDRR
jgi:hypothetical protein